jgi:membrane-bound inhibitor of C-type lysozyme
LVPRPLVLAAALLACGCNEIRYQTARLRANSPKLEVPKVASLPDRRVTYECKNGEPFTVLFPPGGAGAVMTLGGDDFALRDLTAIAGKRYGDNRYELYIKEDGSVYVTLEEKRIREGCNTK